MAFSRYDYHQAALDRLNQPPPDVPPPSRDPFGAPTHSALGEQDYRHGGIEPPDHEPSQPNVDDGRFTYPLSEPTRERHNQR
ncbi:MAG: hypothetical protein WBV80_21960 [Mycobacterium sp.]